MKSTNIILLAAIIAVTGKWVKQQKVDKEMVVGGIFLAIAIAFASEANENLADKFAWLVLLAVIGSNADDLFKAIGSITAGGAATAQQSATAGVPKQQMGAGINRTLN